MIGLPQLLYADGIGKRTQTQFGGYNHNLFAQDGELWDMKNLTSDCYPLIAPRARRYKLRTLTKPNGLYAKDALYWVDGTGFYAGGVQKGTVEDSKKQFAGLGDFIVILPDKKVYNRRTGTFQSMEAAWTGTASFQDGTLYGEPAEGNTITAQGVDWSGIFSVGDAVEITGTTNTGSRIIREIDGDKLRFYENSFTAAEAESVSISRSVPDMDFVCENENRLWGCKGSTIYASKLGDVFNWNVFDGLSTDSFAVDVGSAGEFTGCTSYLGYPCFFKEENIYKVYGNKPSNFEVMGSASLGVERGSGASLAIAGETLFYLSRTGVAAYTGGTPQSVASAFGGVRYKNAVAGSDGTKYYVSMQDTAGAYTLFVFDTRSSLWHKENGMQLVGCGWNEELYLLDASGNLWLSGNARAVPKNAEREAALESMAEFGDFTEMDPNRKGTAKLQLRIEVDAGAEVKIFMQFDSDGVWRQAGALKPEVKRSYYLPVIPRRSDHFRIKITGVGDWRLYSITRESYSGSEL